MGVLHLFCPGCLRWICTHKPSLLCPVYQGRPNVPPLPALSQPGVVDVDWREDPKRELSAPAEPAAREEDEWP